MNRHTKICVLVLVVALVVLALAAPMADAKRKVIPPNATPHGAPTASGPRRWWQWALAIPEDQSPFYDETGANVAVGQKGSRVVPRRDHGVRLGAAWRGPPATSPIPHGRMLFFPVINAEMSPPEGPGVGIDTWQGLVDFTMSYIDARARRPARPSTGATSRSPTRTASRRPRSRRTRRRTRCPRAACYIPFGVAPGTYPFFSDGYYVMLAPLSSGEHTVALPRRRRRATGWTFETAGHVQPDGQVS